MPEMTERQAKAWPDAVAELNRAIGFEDTINTNSQSYGWAIIWQVEQRPERGQRAEGAS